jgi:phage tail tape-measure protein
VKLINEAGKRALAEEAEEAAITGTRAGTSVLGTFFGVIGIVLGFPQKTGGPDIDMVHDTQPGAQSRGQTQETEETPEPQTSTSGAGARKGGGPKAADAPGVTAGNQATNRFGQKLSGSGRPQVNNVNKNTREAARNAANKGSGVIHDRKSKRGKSHFHTKRGNGNKKRYNVHYNYPK